MKHVLLVAFVFVSCAAERAAVTPTSVCDAAYNRLQERGLRQAPEVRASMRQEVITCLQAVDPAAAERFRANTHAEFLKTDLEAALMGDDEAKLKALFVEWASRGPNMSEFASLRANDHLRMFSWARPWVARIATTSMAPPRSDLAGWARWLGGYYGKPDVDLRVANALGEQSKGRLALWQGRVVKARIDSDATWMLVEEFVPNVVLRGQSVGYYDIKNEYVEQRESRGLFFLVRIPATDERYAKYDYVVVLGEVSGSKEQKGKIIDQVTFSPAAEEPVQLLTVDAWDVTPKGAATWSEPIR